MAQKTKKTPNKKKSQKKVVNKKDTTETSTKSKEKSNKILKKDTISQNVSKNAGNSKISQEKTPSSSQFHSSKDGCMIDSSGNVQIKDKVFYINSGLAGKKIEIIQYKGNWEARSIENPNIYYELSESKKKA